MASLSHSHRSSIAALALITPILMAQDPPPTDRQDAISMLQGTSRTPKIDPDRITEVENWLGKIRKAHPEVRKIHARGYHEPGAAVVFFRPEAEKVLGKAKWKTEKNRLPILEGSSGIAALDKPQTELGVSLSRYVFENSRDLWKAQFDKDFDVLAACRRYQQLAGVEEAAPNHYAGDGDEIILKTRGSKLLIVFKHGWGDCPAGCINNHFSYFEVDTAAGTLEKRGELKPEASRGGRINLWGVPARFAVAPFADFDAVLKASIHDDWWVTLHAVEVTGTMLAGRATPWLGEDTGLNQARFERVRDGIKKRPHAAYSLLIHALEHSDADVRKSALRHLRNVTKLKHGGNAEGIRAWWQWLEAKKLNK